MAKGTEQASQSTVWHLVESRTVLEAPTGLKVTCQAVRLPDNRILDDYYRVEMPAFATTYALTEAGQVLVLRQYKHGVGKVCLTLPGGHVEPGECAEFAARRELLEETGYGGGRWLPAHSLVVHGNQHVALSHVFVATNVIRFGAPSASDLEAPIVETMSHQAVRQAILDGLMPITSHVAAFGIAEALLRP